MELPDVNVLIYAFRRDTDRHADYRRWLVGLAGGAEAFGISEWVLASVIRIVTNPKAFKVPSQSAEATAFCQSLLDRENCRLIRPTAGHWELFLRMCREGQAKGNLVSDAWFAALAIESGSTWITTDRDYARFPGLRWRHPLDDPNPRVNALQGR
jgi:toxin-antitoxin system PIN domain toxin